MLTNTVILFLRDLLPMFIMFAYLRTIFQDQKPSLIHVMGMVGGAIVTSMLVLFYYESIGEMFEGTGIEWLRICLILTSFFSFLFAHYSHLRSYSLRLAVTCLLTLHFSSFLLYLTIYFANDELVYELVIGCAVGAGICVSFYFLFSFVIQELWRSKYSWLVLIFWSLFMANQLSLISNYLHQIDVVTFGSSRLIDMSHWVKEGSEYGFILKSLTAFDSSPSTFYGLVVLVGFISMYSFSMFNRHRLLGGTNEK